MNRLYRSLAASFRLDFHLPDSPLINPPAVTFAADENLAEIMTSSAPPQAVLMDVSENLTVTAPDGSPLGNLMDCLRLLKGRAYPILRFASERAGAAIAALADGHCLGDAALCVPYELRAILPAVRTAMPLSRGMLDCRGTTLPDDLLDLSAECHAHDATMLLVDRVPPRAEVRRLQKRFIQVWIDADPAAATLAGACGVVTGNPAELYDLFARFPENTTARPTPLYAHKGLHVTGEFPENSIKAAAGAGKYGYDAAEIDITLTADDVAIVHHDRNTANLFDGDLTVYKSTFAELSQLRRRDFPDDRFDRFDDLMTAMAGYPETPALIEIKTPAFTFGAEELIRQMGEILGRPGVQKHCTCIMGVMPPYLSYVHSHLPRLPVAHCTGAPKPAPETPDEANLLIYGFAQDTKGANAGYNPFHPAVNALFARLAHLRGITVFPWSWAFKPWDEEREPLSAAFAAGYDGLTSDWVTEFADFPIDLIPELPAEAAAGQPVIPKGRLILRTGETVPADNAEILPLQGAIERLPGGAFTGRGEVRLALIFSGALPDGKPLRLCSETVTMNFI
ncbi:MAG: hypothetical protein IJO98_06955 [Clostridia bacterium]|nr:hypothetical protein [Clostridia bacterium]